MFRSLLLGLAILGTFAVVTPEQADAGWRNGRGSIRIGRPGGGIRFRYNYGPRRNWGGGWRGGYYNQGYYAPSYGGYYYY